LPQRSEWKISGKKPLVERSRTPSPVYQPMRVKSPDETPNNEISTLRSKIAELERREIS
jgi:hypothetical protein